MEKSKIIKANFQLEEVLDGLETLIHHFGAQPDSDKLVKAHKLLSEVKTNYKKAKEWN